MNLGNRRNVMNRKEVSNKYDVPSDTPRYWERVGAIPPVRKDSKGYQDFDSEDLDWVYFVKWMEYYFLKQVHKFQAVRISSIF